MKGNGGSVKWGYRPVVSLGTWTLTMERGKTDGTLTAQATDCDEVGVEQAPLVVVVPAGQQTWRWPVRSLRRDGLTVTMTVGVE